MDWQDIKTAPTDSIRDVILWNGKRVFVGWHSSDKGWCDSTLADHCIEAEMPQPTHWMPFPEPPSSFGDDLK